MPAPTLNLKHRNLEKILQHRKNYFGIESEEDRLNGMHFRKQHPYNIYILDFFCFKANLAIEVEGKIHLKKMEYDKERTRFLESSGLKVLRFKNEDVEKRIDWVIENN